MRTGPIFLLLAVGLCLSGCTLLEQWQGGIGERFAGLETPDTILLAEDGSVVLMTRTAGGKRRLLLARASGLRALIRSAAKKPHRSTDGKSKGFDVAVPVDRRRYRMRPIWQVIPESPREPAATLSLLPDDVSTKFAVCPWERNAPYRVRGTTYHLTFHFDR